MTYTVAEIVDAIWAYPTRTLDGNVPVTSDGTRIDDIRYAIWTYPTRTVGGGGTNYFRNILDNINITHPNIVRRLGAIRTRTETVGITHPAIARIMAYRRTRTETVGITHPTIVRRVDHRRLRADTVGITHPALVVIKIIIRSIFNSIGITDSLARRLNFRRTRNENIGVADVRVRSVGYRRTRLDTETVTDLLTRIRTIIRKITDTVSITHILSYLRQKRISLFDNAIVSDSLKRTMIFRRIRTETVSISVWMRAGKLVVAFIQDSIEIFDSLIYRVLRRIIDGIGKPKISSVTKHGAGVTVEDLSKNTSKIATIDNIGKPNAVVQGGNDE